MVFAMPSLPLVGSYSLSEYAESRNRAFQTGCLPIDIVLGDLGGLTHRARLRVRIDVRATLTALHDDFSVRLAQHPFYCLDHDRGKEGKSV